MHLKSIHIENYRLLKDVTISLDRNLTLFVGKNNTGKTSIIDIIRFLLSGANSLAFDDYPLESRQKLYSAIVDYWSSDDPDRVLLFQQSVPVSRITLVIDYSDGELGNLSAFVIDLDETVEEAIIQVSFDISMTIEDVLAICKRKFDSLLNEESTSDEKKKCLQSIVREKFESFFKINIVAVNPTNHEDILEKKKSDLQNLFHLKVIHAERNMGESEVANSNPLSKIMRQLFNTELDEMETGLQESMLAINELVAGSNFMLQNSINTHMDTIVQSMMRFGYPSPEDMSLHANTNLALEDRIIDETELTYISRNAPESLPETHNGLGYKNLIKITLELHDYARVLRDDRTKLALLCIEEPEAHMHPQLQTTFVSYIEEFLNEQVGVNVVQTLMTTHSAHIANTVPFAKVRYIRRFTDYIECKAMSVFPMEGSAEERAARLDFLQKYMKLSFCDLYFCDKAILVEGASERLLIPNMIKKCKEAGDFGEVSPSLASQYYSIIEVGGAYAHHFYDFVDYLGIPTLILTDIDFVHGMHGCACNRAEAERSSNAAINRWCKKMLDLENEVSVPIADIIALTEEQHTDRCCHIEYQTEENGFHARSLEDAIINCNREMFGVRNDEDPNFKPLNMKKTDFAIRLLVESDYSDYQVPEYIKKGLVWLNNQSRVGGQ